MSLNRRKFFKFLGVGGVGTGLLAASSGSVAEIVEDNISKMPKKPVVNKNTLSHSTIQFPDVEGGLKVLHHVVAEHYPVCEKDIIVKGQLLALNSNGEAVPYTNEPFVIGIAGDQSGWINANSFYNKAWEFEGCFIPGRISVYSGAGGEFYIKSSLFVNASEIKVGKFVKPFNNGMYFVDSNEKISPNTDDFAQILNVIVIHPEYIDSGIPNVNPPVHALLSEEWILIRTLV